MNEGTVIDIVRRFIEETKFPKTCPTCERRYESLSEYLAGTRHIGEPLSYDATDDHWQPDAPQGTFSLANCPCGNTLAIDSTGMPNRTLWRLVIWARIESAKRRITIPALLADIRNKIDRQVRDEMENRASRA